MKRGTDIIGICNIQSPYLIKWILSSSIGSRRLWSRRLLLSEVLVVHLSLSVSIVPLFELSFHGWVGICIVLIPPSHPLHILFTTVVAGFHLPELTLFTPVPFDSIAKCSAPWLPRLGIEGQLIWFPFHTL